jgi:hypothetical protein
MVVVDVIAVRAMIVQSASAILATAAPIHQGERDCVADVDAGDFLDLFNNDPK